MRLATVKQHAEDGMKLLKLSCNFGLPQDLSLHVEHVTW